jgi:2-polyprenyl-3-methyl-5-hydroxy-6-metoxy-1,4-benzoquinol methylase
MEIRYNDVALHFDKTALPPEVERLLAGGSVALVDLGSGDGPWFAELARRGLIGPSTPTYAVDLEAERLARISRRFPWITVIQAPADHVDSLPAGTVNVVLSTMVMEHVPDEAAYLREIERLLVPGGHAYITTVYKRPWAWYFRRRDGESVLDTSHLREYTDVRAFRELIRDSCGLRIASISLRHMWFPLLDPILHRICHHISIPRRLLQALRVMKVPVLGYYDMHVILSKPGDTTVQDHAPTA